MGQRQSVIIRPLPGKELGHGPCPGQETAEDKFALAAAELVEKGQLVHVLGDGSVVITPRSEEEAKGEEEEEELPEALRYFMNHNHSDCLITSGHHHLHCKRAYLVRWSSYFRAALVGGFKESIKRHITLELPAPDQLLPTLTYLYTGQMPPLPSSQPEALFGLLKNANYLASDRLSKDCSTVLQDHLVKFLRGEEYFTHEAFEITWVPAEIVRSAMDRMTKPANAVRMVIYWLRYETAPVLVNEDVEGIVVSCQKLAAECSVDELLKLAQLPLSTTYLKIVVKALADKLQTVPDANQYGKALVGARIKVAWPSSRWYAGRVTEYNAVSGHHKVVYDDGDVREYKLSKKVWQCY